MESRSCTCRPFTHRLALRYSVVGALRRPSRKLSIFDIHASPCLARVSVSRCRRPLPRHPIPSANPPTPVRPSGAPRASHVWHPRLRRRIWARRSLFRALPWHCVDGLDFLYGCGAPCLKHHETCFLPDVPQELPLADTPNSGSLPLRQTPPKKRHVTTGRIRLADVV